MDDVSETRQHLAKLAKLAEHANTRAVAHASIAMGSALDQALDNRADRGGPCLPEARLGGDVPLGGYDTKLGRAHASEPRPRSSYQRRPIS